MVIISILGVVVAILLLICFLLENKRMTAKVEADKAIALLDYEKKKSADLLSRLETSEKKVSDLQKDILQISKDKSSLRQKLQSIEEDRVRLEKETHDRFAVLAQEILEKNTKSFSQSSENSLGQLLKPLKENIDAFKALIVNTSANDARQHGELQSSIKQLLEANNSIGKEAKELTNALRGNSKVQGDWGEMILTTLLQKSGLKENEQFFVQVAKNSDGSLIKTDNGKSLRADVVVKYPDEKYVVIDSKVSLTAYVNYMNADNEEDRAVFGKKHVDSVRAHVKELTGKNYQDYVGIDPSERMDYQLMFIPNEHAYLVAMTLDNKIWQEAYDNRIVIISPAHVMSTLQLIAQLWKRDNQNKNALAIATESGKLYDKFVGFVEDMKKVENALNTAQRSFNDASKKLSTGNGNIVTRLNKIKTLGANATKLIPNETDD